MDISDNLKEILQKKYDLRKALSQVCPNELVDYIMELIVQDLTHRKFLDL